MSQLFGTVISYLENSKLYRPDSEITNYLDSMFHDSCYASASQLGRNDIEDIIELKLKQLLPFLRAAALIRHHIYEEDLPFICERMSLTSSISFSRWVEQKTDSTNTRMSPELIIIYSGLSQICWKSFGHGEWICAICRRRTCNLPDFL